MKIENRLELNLASTEDIIKRADERVNNIMKNIAKKEPEFWDCQDSEVLDHTDKDDAIEYFLDGWLSGKMTKDEVLKALPETTEVKGYAKMKVNYRESWLSPLEDVLERLDEEYGDPSGGDYSKPTDRMKAAEKEFLKVIVEEYEPWMCEEVCKEEINTLEWVRENRPDWLEDEK
jgi:hypothetical protein